MDSIKNEMIIIYETYDLDWMNYLICSDLTYHHIIKYENGGAKTIDNGALLTKRAHEYLHFIEGIDLNIYNRMNKVFKEINIKKQRVSNIEREKIELLLLEFEIKNTDRIIRKKEKLGKIRKLIAVQRRIDSQLGKK